MGFFAVVTAENDSVVTARLFYYLFTAAERDSTVVVDEGDTSISFIPIMLLHIGT